MPLPSFIARRTRTSALGLRRTAAAVLAAGLALVAVGVPASLAAPLVPAYPTVFISQLLQGGSATTMRSVEQSRLAGAGVGGVTITTLAPNGTAAFLYNAVAFRPTDGYLYAVSANRQLVRVEHDGTATELGSITNAVGGATIAAAQYSGTFGTDPNILFTRPTGASNQLNMIDVTTRTFTSRSLSATVNVNDFTFASGYLWGVDGSSASKNLVRIDPTTGAVTTVNVTSVFPAGDDNRTPPGGGSGGYTTGYGAAWTYGNGNLAFSYNATGNITQIRITNPSATTPSVTYISSIAGPSTAQNDGATTPAAPTDLQVHVTQPPVVAPGTNVMWTVEVSNEGPNGSSGATFSYPVPAGVTGVTVPTGCTLASGVVQCVSGQLPADGTDTYTFTGSTPTDPTVSTSSTVTVVGNEADPSTNTAVLRFTPQDQDLTSTGIGTDQQVLNLALPDGASVTLLDGNLPTSSVVVPGEGTYAVSGSALTFDPELGFDGVAQGVSYEITAGSESGRGTYTATVTKPSPPAAADLTSQDVSPHSQSVTATLPTGGTLTLLDADQDPVTSLTVAGGTYDVDPATGVISFTPTATFTGPADPVTYRVTDAYSQTGEGTYTATVTAPAAPSATDLTSTGVGSSTQSPASAIAIPTGGAVTLLEGGTPTTTVTVTGQGTYDLDTAAGTLQFTPVTGFTGTADPVTYRVTDAYGQLDEATYTATVTAPAGPNAPSPTTTGVGVTPQVTTVTTAPGSTLTLLDSDADPVTTVTVTGQGTYELDPSTGTITFTPVLGFQGQASGVSLRITDTYGQSSDGTYTPTVVAPAAPSAGNAVTSGPAVTDQQVSVHSPTGTTVRLLDASSNPVTTVEIPGQGTYVLDPDTGVITFTPVLGFSGTADGVRYQIIDSYGQSNEGSYTPTVVAPTGPTAAALTTTGVGVAAQSTPVPASGTVSLLDGAGDPATTVTIDGQGTYLLELPTGITFTPVLGFHGEATPVTFEVRDAYGQTARATYTPTVLKPAGPLAEPFTSSGGVGSVQHPQSPVVIPDGGAVTLLDAHGDPATTVTVPGQGAYTLDQATGVLGFTPAVGYVGTAAAVTYRVTDAYGQVAVSTYVAVVAASPAAAGPSAPGQSSPQSAPVPPAEAAQATLPRTGADVAAVVAAGAAMFTVGAALLVLTRRRRA